MARKYNLKFPCQNSITGLCTWYTTDPDSNCHRPREYGTCVSYIRYGNQQSRIYEDYLKHNPEVARLSDMYDKKRVKI